MNIRKALKMAEENNCAIYRSAWEDYAYVDSSGNMHWSDGTLVVCNVVDLKSKDFQVDWEIPYLGPIADMK